MDRPHHKFWPKRLPHSLTIPATSLWDNLAISARRYPDKAAIVFFGRVYPYVEVQRQAERLSIQEISARLFISPSTVQQHTHHIYRKLNVANKRQAVASFRAVPFWTGSFGKRYEDYRLLDAFNGTPEEFIGALGSGSATTVLVPQPGQKYDF